MDNRINNYKYEIEETLSKFVTIEAHSKDEAYKMLSQRYNNQEIVLDSNDFVDKNFILISEE